MALQIDTELILSLCYKLRIFAILVNEPANVFSSNKVVYKNFAFAKS